MSKGFILPLVIVVVLLALAGGGIAYYIVSKQEQRSLTIPRSTPTGATTAPLTGGPRLASPAGTPGSTAFTGTVLAGTSAPLLDFNQADFAAAQASDKLIVLYFYANWCPICREEFPRAQAAFNELTTNNVVGFRVNYNDSDTDDAEEALAREQGIAYQHTKVFLKNGQQVLKSPETWETSRYLTEITAAIKE